LHCHLTLCRITSLSHFLPLLESFRNLAKILLQALKMKKAFVLSLMLQLFLQLSFAQDSSAQSSAPTTTTSVSLTPQMSASAVSSLYSVLATSSPQQPGSGPAAGDAGSAPGSSAGDSIAGASGTDTGSMSISKGGVIAIAVCTSFVCIFGGKCSLQRASRLHNNLTCCSDLCYLILPGEEERLEDPREYPQVGKESRISLNSKER